MVNKKLFYTVAFTAFATSVCINGAQHQESDTVREQQLARVRVLLTLQMLPKITPLPQSQSTIVIALHTEVSSNNEPVAPPTTPNPVTTTDTC